MKFRYAIVVCLFVSFLGTPSTYGEATPLVEQQQQAEQIQTLLFKRRYGEAHQILEQYLQKWPDDITGYFGMMMLYQLQNFENFDFRFDRQFLRWHEKGRKLAVKVVNDGKSDPWHLFIASGTLGLSGMYRLNKKQTMRALRDGSMAINALKKAIRKDPEWVDPLYGIGMYDYWRSVFTNRWKFLPFFPDKKAIGLENVQKVVRSGTFAKQLAQGSIAYMYYNDKAYKKAYASCYPLLKKYPSNVILRTLYAHILQKQKKFSEARKQFMRILKRHPQLTKVNLYIARLNFAEAKAEQRKLGKGHSGKDPYRVQAFDKVAPWVETFLQEEPNATERWRASAYILWGDSLYNLHDWVGAEEKYRKALRLDYSLYHPKSQLKKLAKRRSKRS